MSKKILGPRQSQSKTGFYDLKNAVYTKAPARGRPSKNPAKLIDNLRKYKIRVAENSDEKNLLDLYASDIKEGIYGGVAKDSFNEIISALEKSKNPINRYQDLLYLIKVVKEEEEGKDSEHDFDLAVYNKFPKYVGFEPNLIFHSGPEWIDKENPRLARLQDRLGKEPKLSMDVAGDLRETVVPTISSSTLRQPPPQRKAPPRPPVELPTQPSYANMLKNFPVNVDAPTKAPPLPFASRRYIDSEKPSKDVLVKTGSSSSKDSLVNPLVPDDLQNLEALQYEQNYGVGVRDTYGVYDEQKHMFETREERDTRRRLEEYKDEIQMLGNRSNSTFRGADIYDGDDMDTLREEGNSAGGAELKKPYTPDIFNNMKPQAPIGQTAKGKIGLPKQPSSQRIYPTISGIGLSNYNRPQQRPIRQEGISGNDNLAQDRRVQVMDDDRLGMRVTRSYADLSAQQNALTNVGGGIMSQIANNLRQSADSGEEKKNGDDGLYGAEGSMFNNQDVSNPRTLNERFSRLGQQRMTKNFKINKYVNLKNNKQKYDTVTAPSLKEIRARTLGYVQPSSKVGGNSVELIRQSNATQMKLNNLFMP